MDRPGRHICSECLERIPFIPQKGCCSVCGRAVEGMDGEYLCEDCRRPSTKPAFDRAASAVSFDEIPRQMILDYKFNGAFHLVRDFTDWLEAALNVRFPVPEIDVVLPMPITLLHRWDRGYNQTAYLAKALAKRIDRRYDPRQIRRVGSPERQGGLKEDERRENVRNTFAVPHPEWIRGRTVLVVDDIMSTGSTFSEASATLKKAGASRVWCLSLARSVRAAFALIASFLVGGALAAETYCNPLALPDYPVGSCRVYTNGTEFASSWEQMKWNTPGHRSLQFRELADPSVIVENGAWYIFPSLDLCWKSTDNGATWKHIPLGLSGAENHGEGDRLDYAPTIIKHNGEFLLLGSKGILFVAKNIEGPYTEKGEIVIPKGEVNGERFPWMWDPMLFSDDGRLYLYWGSTDVRGIWGCELDNKDYLKVIDGTITKLIPFEPESQPWEVWPRNLMDKKVGFLEGAWMYRHDDKYILTYAAAGTDNPDYAMGQAIGSSPLGKFTKPKNNPFLKTVKGPVVGTSHGSVIDGPDGRPWVAYTMYVGGYHWFERMIGMDRVRFAADGSVEKMEATSTPQYLTGGDTGWKPLVHKVSHPAEAAGDLNFATFWTPEKIPAEFTVDFAKARTVKSYRLIWRDVGLDEKKGVCRGPYQYRIEYRDGDEWKLLVDASKNDMDMFIDYRETGSVKTDSLRFTVLGGPKGIIPAVAEFTPFGL